MDEPLVSVLLASYNNGKYILETLASIYNQTYKNIELVIVDDHSKDNSVEMINTWLSTHSSRFSNVEFICHDTNKGICVVANVALNNSKGKYVNLIGSDDVMISSKIDQQVSILERTTDEVGMIYSDAYLFDENGAPIYGWFIQKYRQEFISPPSGWIFDDLLKSNFIPGMSVIIKRSVFDTVGHFDETLVFEDYDLWLRIAEKYKIIYCDTPLVKYRIVRSSLVHTIKKWNPSILRIFLKFRDKALVREKIIEIAKDCYFTKDTESLEMLQKIDINIPQVKKIVWLSKYRIPYFIGKRIVHRTIK